MKVIGYFLIKDAPSHSIQELQVKRQALYDFCHENQHTLVEVYTDDLSSSGTRHAWQKLLDAIGGARKGFLVGVSGAADLGDSLEEAVSRVLELDAIGSRVVCADEHYPDPLRNALAFWGRADRRERIREGMRVKAIAGLGLGRPPIGYKIGFNRKLEVVPEEAQVVQRIYHLYLEEKLGVRLIAQRLNQEQVQTRGKGRWSMVAIREILRNRTYLGTYSRFGSRIPGNHPGIISTETFRQVQSRLSQKVQARRRFNREPFLLSGLLICGYCGNSMIGVTRHQRWHRKDGTKMTHSYRYYQCETRTNQSGCSYSTRRAKSLEQSLIARLRKSMPLKATVFLKSKLSPEHISGLEMAYRRSLRQAANGAISLAQVRAVWHRLLGAREALHSYNSTPSQQVNPRAYLRPLFWDSLEFLTRQSLLQTLVKRAVVKDKELEITLNPQAFAKI